MENNSLSVLTKKVLLQKDFPYKFVKFVHNSFNIILFIKQHTYSVGKQTKKSKLQVPRNNVIQHSVLYQSVCYIKSITEITGDRFFSFKF